MTIIVIDDNELINNLTKELPGNIRIDTII